MVWHWKILNTLLLLLTLAAHYGCVGTVQQAEAQKSVFGEPEITKFNFPGLTAARGIAHDKIELEFFPANGNPLDIQYYLLINNSDNPIKISLEALGKASGGRYRYVLRNLNMNSEYKLKITAENKKTGALSQEENEIFARTFDNTVANFDGVAKLALVPGATDRSVRVDWIPAPMNGLFVAGPYDPAHYEISYITDVGGPDNLNNPNYNGTDKVVLRHPNPPLRAAPGNNPSFYVLENLQPNTKYYMQVRAINSLWQDFKDDPDTEVIPVDRELNSKFLTIQTESSTTLFDFNVDALVLANAAGIDAFDKVDVFWAPGAGSFYGYRVYWRKYTETTGNPREDDKMDEAELVTLTNTLQYKSIAPTEKYTRVSGLDDYSWYQFKVALCKTAACPVESTDPNAAIFSGMKAIRVEPTLAPFSGITFIEQPKSFDTIDEIKLNFESPVLSSGFATDLEFYCVDPTDHDSMVKFPGFGVAISGQSSGLALCNNLMMTGTLPSLGTWRSQVIKGVDNSGTKEYCFAATPAIVGYDEESRLSPANRVVRCLVPEVRVPTVDQFAGFSGGCQVNQNNVTLTWPAPSQGIFSNYKVFWREKTPGSKFDFNEATTDPSPNLPPYFESADLANTTQNLTVNDLRPGKTYIFGVLTFADAGGDKRWSEFNLGTRECNIPMPKATFQEWTRIFALGPKVDGRHPNDSLTKEFRQTAKMYEALNADGIPFEVKMNTPTTPSMTDDFQAPPGFAAPATYAQAFDGAPNADTWAMSRDGIISLAWEDVELDFLGSEMTSQQDQGVRNTRSYGYRVYRSADNKLSWQDLTTVSGLIHAGDHTYRKRMNASTITTRMAFFTDYSVKSVSAFHDAANARDVDRARVYWYKIVPVFDGRELVYPDAATNPIHIIKVTLPPPNMALMHRMMANRGRCMEINKEYGKSASSHYACDYNGLGSSQKSFPWQVNNTQLDQGGDVLVDRFELACRYTRGDIATDPDTGDSNFDLDTFPKRPGAGINDYNAGPKFRGYAAFDNAEDPARKFKGCWRNNDGDNANQTGGGYPNGLNPTYAHTLRGDCTGNYVATIPAAACTPTQLAEGWVTNAVVIAPGARNGGQLPSGAYDCTNNLADDPQVFYDRYYSRWAMNDLMQAEPFAVFHNQYAGGGGQLPIPGPDGTNTGRRRVVDYNWGWGSTSANCAINLAAIDGDGYMVSRWIDAYALRGRTTFKGGQPDMLTKTVADVLEVYTGTTASSLTLYNGTYAGAPLATGWNVPSTDLLDSPRFRTTTRLGRVLASNAAKLPPLTGMSQDTAQSMCGLWNVQVGFATDSGSFLATTAPIKKRLLRRKEMLTASQWPDSYDATRVYNIEANGAMTRSCNNSFKALPGSSVGTGNPIRLQSAFRNGGTSGYPFITGSSRYDESVNYKSTEECVSRYGVQDILGNVMEHTPEKIFCDFTKDKLFFGPKGAFVFDPTVTNNGNPNESFPFWNSNDVDSDGPFVLKFAPDMPNGASLTFSDGTPTKTVATDNLGPWVSVKTESGYCSYVDADSDTRDTGPVFQTSGIFAATFLPNGSVNSTIIRRTNSVDQASVDGMRDGNGRFLDFGLYNLAPALNRYHTLALSRSPADETHIAQGKFFNPIVGLPLTCADGTCDDPLLSEGSDNKKITTNFFVTENAGAYSPDEIAGLDINNYPVGNSAITNVGVSEYRFDYGEFRTLTVNQQNNGVSVITNISSSSEAALSSGSGTVTTVSSSSWPDDTILELFQVRWALDRNAEIEIFQGGNSAMSSTGRFTANVLDKNSFTGVDAGARCGVLINTED